MLEINCEVPKDTVRDFEKSFTRFHTVLGNGMRGGEAKGRQPMTEKNETMRAALRDIEGRGARCAVGAGGLPAAEVIAHAASPAAATRNAGQPLNH